MDEDEEMKFRESIKGSIIEEWDNMVERGRIESLHDIEDN